MENGTINHIYETRVVDVSKEQIVREIKKANRRMAGILIFNLIFCGAVVIDLLKRSQYEDQEG